MVIQWPVRNIHRIIIIINIHSILEHVKHGDVCS